MLVHQLQNERIGMQPLIPVTLDNIKFSNLIFNLHNLNRNFNVETLTVLQTYRENERGCQTSNPNTSLAQFQLDKWIPYGA